MSLTDVLIRYIQKKDLQAVQSLLAEGASPHEADVWGWSPIHCACSSSVEIVKLLLARGASPHVRDGKFSTPLHYAALSQDCEIIDLLLKAGAAINAQNVCRETPLHKAITYDEVVNVKKLLAHGASLHIRDERRKTPLQNAVSVEMIEILLSKGAEINAQDKYGTTSLHEAAQRGQIEILTKLLAKGALLHITDRLGDTPLHQATRKTPEILLNHGASVHCINKQGEMPLHKAASRNPALVSLLLAKGASPNARDIERKTPLYFALLSVLTVPIPETLLAQGSLINVRDKFDNTPFYWLVSKINGRLHVLWSNRMRLLLSNGAYLDTQSKNLLGKHWKECRLITQQNEHFFITLLIAGIHPKLYEIDLPNRLKPTAGAIEATFKSWLSPLINAPQTINWSKTSYQILQALPRLIHFIKRLTPDKAPSISQGYTIKALKSVLFIPGKPGVNVPYFLNREDESDCEELPVLKKLDPAEWLIDSTDRSFILSALAKKQLPVELILAIRERLADWAMVDTFIADYQLDASVANYLVFDAQSHLNDYITFLKRLFEHDWRNALPYPLDKRCSTLASCKVAFINFFSSTIDLLLWNLLMSSYYTRLIGVLT